MKKVMLLNFSLVVVAACSAVTSSAQMVNCDVFLKGNHMELGINSDGAFGTSVQAPVGYHANVTDTLYDDCAGYMSTEVFQQLGFVADPNLMGWSHYYGDFIMPGNPREGWAIADDSGTATAYSYNYYTGTSGYTGSLAGGNVAYTATGGIIQGSWSGIFHSTLHVNQLVTIDTGNLFLLVHVGFYNAGTVPDSFYYLRTINPHNEEVLTSGTSTTNKVEHQLPNPDGLIVISASGTVDTLAYIAMGTRDPRAKAFIVKDSTLPGPGSLASIWAGDSTHYAYGGSLTGNQGIGLVYKISTGAGDSTFLDFGYSFKGGIIDTVLDTSLRHTTGGGGGGPLVVRNISGSSITVYPNPASNTVTVSGMGSGNSIAVFDALGRQVAVVPQSAITGGVGVIAVNAWPSGVYVVVVSNENGHAVSRTMFTKQ